MSSSYDRVSAAMRSVYDRSVDTVSPGRVLLDEWKRVVRPALEAQKDLAPDTLELLGKIGSYSPSSAVRRAVRDWLRTEKDKYLPAPGPGPTPDPGTGVIPLRTTGRYPVYLNAQGTFTLHADGAQPANAGELGSSLFRAAKWVEDDGGRKNLFVDAQVPQALKDKVFQNLVQALGQTQGLAPVQQKQLVASVGCLLIELIKSLPDQGAASVLKGQAFDAVAQLISTPGTSPTTAHILIARLQDKSITAGLAEAQKTIAAQLLDQIAPRAPMDYAAFKRQALRDGKMVLTIDHCAGQGEGFLVGYALALEADGYVRKSGTPQGPAEYVKTFPTSDKWGVPVEVHIKLRDYNDDLYVPMADPNVHWVSYGGHSNFGRNKLNSLKNAPAAVGYKMILTDLCCGADGIDAEFAQYPGIQNLTSHASTYFRTRQHPTYGKIAHQSEGYDMMQTMINGVVAQKNWDQIENDLQRDANWWGHPTANNWITPNAWRRRLRELDADDDGISDLVDALPTYDTFDVVADTAREWDLAAPSTPADQINGRRAFLATRALNTATGYNPELQTTNGNRDVVGGPGGIWFDAKAGDKEYVRFADVPVAGGGTVLGVQFSSALADMTVEGLRAVLFYEYVQHLARKREINLDAEEAKVMGLVFVAASLEYDQGYRDQDIFDNLKRIYGFPANVDYQSVSQELSRADSARHNYTGDVQAVRALKRSWGGDIWNALRGVGTPSVPVK